MSDYKVGDVVYVSFTDLPKYHAAIGKGEIVNTNIVGLYPIEVRWHNPEELPPVSISRGCTTFTKSGFRLSGHEALLPQTRWPLKLRHDKHPGEYPDVFDNVLKL